ncbi:Sporulation initiation inhibitor protein Soj (modular protein) [uncultured Desulfobacterium sp.]|uniref:Sporulation initiation inhibitor protein Soj (Modular protein) n=1 Tax=uncultured Desulfobacterium sp. TaxID=201089 RepID=A0A445MRH6_9BACT|nr:Sporulation initiation inhibitor protein Soj (modular protein) [uncultured Desulfobacterium sp.]
MRIIASANQKGGCGKTTTAINLSSSLSMKGQRVMIIDFDPQAHATMGLNIKPSELEKNIYDVITPKGNQDVGIEDIIIPIKDNLDLAPAGLILSVVEQELSGIEGREDRLFNAIRAIKQQYDYVIIDCPPSIGHLCFNALRASDEVIIPIDMSLFSLRGVSKLTELIILLNEKTGHESRARALITMYDARTRYSRVVLDKVRKEFGNNVFETVIRYNIRLRETVDYGLPVGDYDKNSLGHKDYENLADEILRSDAAVMYQDLNTLSLAQDLLQRTEGYMDAATKSELIGQHVCETEEDFYLSEPKSTFSEMVEAMATDSSNPSPDYNYDEM